MSTAHLTELQVQGFCARSLSDDDLTIVAAHIEECEYCDRRACYELGRLRQLPPYTEDDLAFCVRNCHLDIETLMGLAEGTWDSEPQWLFGLHLKTCESCTEDLKTCERCVKEDRRLLDDPSRHDDLSN